MMTQSKNQKSVSIEVTVANQLQAAAEICAALDFGQTRNNAEDCNEIFNPKFCLPNLITLK